MWTGDGKTCLGKIEFGVYLNTSGSNINSGIAMVLIQTTHLFGFKPLVWNHTSAWRGDMAKINIPLNNQKKCWEVAQYFFCFYVGDNQQNKTKKIMIYPF